MYQFYYDFVVNNLIGVIPDGVSDGYIQDLTLILTHVSLILTFVACVIFLIWFFKFVSGLLFSK